MITFRREDNRAGLFYSDSEGQFLLGLGPERRNGELSPAEIREIVTRLSLSLDGRKESEKEKMRGWMRELTELADKAGEMKIVYEKFRR